MQIYKKDVIVSGTIQAVVQHGVDDEFDHQKTERLREVIRDLEKSTILSILSGNTIGGVTATRTQRGIRSALATNAASIGTLTESWFGNTIKLAWDNGGSDLNLTVIDSTGKRLVDGFQGSAKQVIQGQGDNLFRNWVDTYQSTFGTMRIVLSRWMPNLELFNLASGRCRVVPLRQRSFQFIETARTGDSRKGFVVGEYTTEVRNEAGMSRAKFTG
jgi:hypothetical protein